MGMFLNMIDSIKPAIKWALKQKNSGRGQSNSRSVEIPEQMWNMKETPVDENSKRMAGAISALLIKTELAGEDNIFTVLGEGKSIKGRIIRYYVASMALKKSEDDIKRVFIQMLLDTTIPGSVQDHVAAIVKLMGDDPNAVKTKLQEVATETLVTLEDEDFENAISKIF